MSNEVVKELREIKEILYQLLKQNTDASQKPHDGLQPESKPVPARKRPAKVKPVDFKTMYRKRGIV